MTTSKNRRLKRTFDVILTLLLLGLIPFWVWIHKQPRTILKEMGNVLLNRRTWISGSADVSQLKMKPGVFLLQEAFPESREDQQMKQRLEWAYLQNYSIANDLKIFFRVFFRRRLP
jgi:lipopolysaccharide/colanic/teichoic acid biosynthesis glycosyltransferase